MIECHTSAMAANNVRGSKKYGKVKDTDAWNEKKDFQRTNDEKELGGFAINVKKCT